MKHISGVIEDISKIEIACFEQPWSVSSIEDRVRSKSSILLTEVRGGTVVGYALGVCLSGEFELYRLAVLPELQGKGIAFNLMSRFIGKCREIEPQGRVFLEVRETNSAAIGLYEKCGFVAIGQRRGYYGNAAAVVMRLLVAGE